MDDTSWRRLVDRFCRQYLQMELKLDFPSGELLKLAKVQDAIYEGVFADGAVRYGPPARYQTRVLKELVSRIEASIDDWDEYGVSDDLMSALTVLFSTPLLPEVASVQQRSYVTYHLSALHSSSDVFAAPSPMAEHRIVLLENRSLISAAGTTGLGTWDAALHLGDYLCRNPSITRGKRVLELGAGTGYLSILCAGHLGAAHVIASDGSDEVMHNLPDNVFLNNLQDSPRVQAMEIRWGHALLGAEEREWNGGRRVDVVLGADITYDHRAMPALTGTMRELFELYPRVEVYISAAQRNEATFRAFLDTCRRSSLVVEDLRFEVPPRELQEGPFYNDQVTISICKVSKAKPWHAT